MVTLKHSEPEMPTLRSAGSYCHLNNQLLKKAGEHLLELQSSIWVVIHTSKMSAGSCLRVLCYKGLSLFLTLFALSFTAFFLLVLALSSQVLQLSMCMMK